MELVKYDAACRAIAEAKTVDEAKGIADRAEAVRAYARQAKNRGMELDAAEIRIRAERRLGEILKLLKLAGKFGKPGRNRRKELTLDDLGIHPGLSQGSQNLASIEASAFERLISRWRSDAETSSRISLPLAHIRLPNARTDSQRVSFLRNPNQIEHDSPILSYRGLDGRPVADWRVSELERLEIQTEIQIRRIRELRLALPVANPEPFATIKDSFRPDEFFKAMSKADGGMFPLTDEERDFLSRIYDGGRELKIEKGDRSRKKSGMRQFLKSRGFIAFDGHLWVITSQGIDAIGRVVDASSSADLSPRAEQPIHNEMFM